MDEVVSDGLLCYLTATDENCGSECATEELSSIKMGKNLCVARIIRQGGVHVGQEIFAVAFARNDETDYSLTCKRGSFWVSSSMEDITFWQNRQVFPS